MPDATGDALCAVVKLTLGEEAGADFSAEVDEQQVPTLLRCQGADLSHRRDLDGASSPERGGEALDKAFEQASGVPVRHGTEVG